MARSSGNKTNGSINRTGGGTRARSTGYAGKGGNASIKRGAAGSKRIDMKAKTTGSNIQPSRTSPYDPGMHK